jgi:hypothetical protein
METKLLCPHCEKPLGVEHDDAGCKRRMSRRVFFGVAVAPLAAAIASKIPTPAGRNAQTLPFQGEFEPYLPLGCSAVYTIQGWNNLVKFGNIYYAINAI